MTPKQQRFVEEYLIDLNATQAAIRAGYSEKTAYEIGHRNLKKVEIEAALEEAFAARSKRVEIDQDAVIRELAAIATMDIRKLFAEDGTPRPILELPEELAAAISSLEIVERRGGSCCNTDYVYKIRFWDKIRALELLGRHLGMFSGRVEVTGKNGEPLLSGLTDDELIARLLAKRRPPRDQDTEERRPQ